MQFDEMGLKTGKTLFLLPGTACDYYTDLLTWLEDDIHVEHTKAHFIYAKKMGEKYLKRYRKYFRDPDIREFDMQHEQWLFGGESYAAPVLKVIDAFMEMPV